MAQVRAASPFGVTILRPFVRGCKQLALLTVSASALVLVGALPAHAHSIQQALALFYANNPTLKAAQLSVSSRNESVNQVSGAALPQVSMNVSANPTRTFGYAGGQGSFERDSAGLGVGVQVTQAVDISGGIGTQIESAYLSLQNGWVAYASQEQALLLEAVNAYMEVISSRARVALNAGAVSLLEAQVRAAEARFEAGVGTRTEVANLQASLAGAKAGVTQSVGARNIANANFQRIFGIEAHNLEFPSHVPGLPRSLNEAIDRAMRTAPALLQAEANVQIAELNIAAQQAARGPSMTLSAGANHNYDLLRSSNDYSTSFSAGGQISIPLYQGGAGASRVRQAEIDRDAAKAQLAAQRQQTRANVVSAWQNLQSTEASLNALVAQVSAAELALGGARAEENAGTKTLLDSLDAENALTNAQINLATTRASVVVASYSLLHAMGDLSAEKLGLGASLFDPQGDLDMRQVDNLATAFYVDGRDRPTATPSFFRWLYNSASSAVTGSAYGN